MTRFVWLHGFASGPTSSKAQFARTRLAERGAELAIPDLNQPGFRALTVSRMLEQVDAIARGAGPLVLFGSSLGGFTAATWAATRPGRSAALVLLAPAFDLAARWEERMGREVEAWRSRGAYAFDHHARGRKEELAFDFLEDARRHPGFPLPECPALVLQGTLDEVVDPSLARAFVSRMQGRARLVELPEGHELTGDLPALWRRMEEFLQPWLPRPTP